MRKTDFDFDFVGVGGGDGGVGVDFGGGDGGGEWCCYCCWFVCWFANLLVPFGKSGVGVVGIRRWGLMGLSFLGFKCDSSTPSLTFFPPPKLKFLEREKRVLKSLQGLDLIRTKSLWGSFLVRD